ncbi:hypothetical protein AVEN_190188-1, partial [Araneus ventricosus]
MVRTADITEAVQNVVDCLRDAADNTIPKCSPRLRKVRRPWWNEACRDSRRGEKKRWNIFRRYPTTENHVAFKRSKALARCIRRRSQRESWINFVSSITSSTSSKQLWTKRADWGSFMQLADITESMVSTADITEAVQNVVDCLNNAAENTIPKCSPRLRKFRRPWWNVACRDSRREEKRLWNIFRRYPTTENHVAFKRAKALARRIRRR